MSENKKPKSAGLTQHWPSPAEFIKWLKKRHQAQVAVTYHQAVKIAEDAKTAGGRALIVGGFVRDYFFGKISKDIDLEVYGLPLEKLRAVAGQGRKTNEVGKVFGVIKVIVGNGLDIDIAPPRRDSKVGEGHRGFSVEFDPNLGVTEATHRRDFTMNSILVDPLTGEIFDPFNGRKDIGQRKLRVTDPEKFGEDPLRVLRAMQFAGRFELAIEPASLKVCQENLKNIKTLSRERLYEEWRKLLLKSKCPSIGLKAGKEIGIFQCLYPELEILSSLPQDKDWHPEGDVWKHTLMVVDAMAGIIRREKLGDESATRLMFAALCHDLGKATTTQKKDGTYISHGHEKAGVAVTRKLMEKLTNQTGLIKPILPLIAEHMWPILLYKDRVKVTDGTIRRLATRTYPATLLELVWVGEADRRGGGTSVRLEAEKVFSPTGEFLPGKWLLERAAKLGIAKEKPAPLISGRDWLAHGCRPGKIVGELMRLADQLRDEQDYEREQVFTAVEPELKEDPTGEKAISKLMSLL